MQAKPFDPKMKWERELYLKADTYNVGFNLFPHLKPVLYENWENNIIQGVTYEQSPCGKWRYGSLILPKGKAIQTYYGKNKGELSFDNDTPIPALWEYRNGEFVRTWMSFSPMEIFSLRGGIRRAKGDCIVAGLGMGYQLIEISKRKQVKRLRLIEQNQSIVDWLMPVIKPLLHCEVEVIIGDAYKVLPTLSADTAIIDIFPQYGNNNWEMSKLEKTCPNIKSFWGWGTAELCDSSYLMPSFFMAYDEIVGAGLPDEIRQAIAQLDQALDSDLNIIICGVGKPVPAFTSFGEKL